MEFFEFLYATSVSVVLPIVLLGQIIRYRRMKLAARRGDDEGLRVSELKVMIHDAVERANAPLRRRIEQIETIVTSPDDSFPLREPAACLSLPEPDDVDRNAPSRVSSRVRA